MNIQWYPGHMTKTRRMIGENLKYVDVVAEVIDARIPIASRNPDLDELVGGKPRVVILNRADQADPAASKVWGAYFRAQGISVLECDARSGAGVKQFSPVMRAALKEQIARWKEKGQVGRPVRAMVVMIPTENSEEIGVRPIVDREQADRVLEEIGSLQVEMTQNWNRRYRENMERLKSGDLFQVACVVKGLMLRDVDRGLSTGERKMLHSAKQILISEIVMCQSSSYEALEARINRAL